MSQRTRQPAYPLPAFNRRGCGLLGALAIAILLTLLPARPSRAVPSFTRKYSADCLMCHTVYPALNPFGEAFRRDGYRFPTTEGFGDSDVATAQKIPLPASGSDGRFRDGVLPAAITKQIPVSAMLAGTTGFSRDVDAAPDDANDRFTWNASALARFYLAGAFDDEVTYFAKATFGPRGGSLEAAYLVWNDVIGPRHALNFSVGRLLAPQLTSYGPRNNYFGDTVIPLISVARLFNPFSDFVVGQGPADGVEASGIIQHRLAYSAGWVASHAQEGLEGLNAEDWYVHFGVKVGGMALDGEGARGMVTMNPRESWAETALTLDWYAYRGLTRADNYTNAPTLTPQRSAVEAIGYSLRGQLELFVATLRAEYQLHSHPYIGSAPTPADPPAQMNALAGVPESEPGKGFIVSGEAVYFVFPWLVPGVRAEFVRPESRWGDKSNYARFVPGLDVLLRPNLKISVLGSIERARGLPPAQDPTSTSWSAAGGHIAPLPGDRGKPQLERVNAFVAWSI